MQSVHLRKYGEQTTVNFDLYEIDGIDLRVDAAHVAGDLTVMKNEGAEANTDNGFTDEGKGYSVVLSATELQAARIVLYVVDQTATKAWLDKVIVIETYGHASAMHAFDLDTAVQGVNIVSSDNIDLTALQKASVNAEADTALTDYDASTSAQATSDAAAIITAIGLLNDVSSADILATAMTEAYAADGAEPTLTQIVYMMWSMMNSLGFVLTVGTANKLDGTTPSMTFAIDDPDNPTTINRET